MKQLKILAMLALLLASLFVPAAAAQLENFNEQIPVYIEQVWINDKTVDNYYCYYDENDEFYCNEEIRGDIERGEKITVEVKIVATETIKDIEVEASIKGYEHSNKVQTSDSTEVFDVKEGRTYYKTLELTLPEDLQSEDTYALRLEISDKDHYEFVRNIILEVNTPRHSLQIEDVILSPGSTVEAGRSLLTSVRVQNFGQQDEKNVKVTLAIPELGVADSDYIDLIKADEEKMTEELYVRIPADAENKDYQAKVTVSYDNDYETVEKTMTFKVIGGKAAAETVEKTVMTVGPETQNLVAGGNEAVYPIALTNAGSESKTYTLTLTTGDWATSRLSENVLVLKSGETKAAYAYVAADKDAAAGEKVIGLKVASGDETLKEITLKANVLANSDWGNFKRVLEIGLVVLVVLLVVIGLIVGFSRMKNKEDEDNEEDSDKKTYY